VGVSADLDGHGTPFHIPSDVWTAQRESVATIGAFLALRIAAWAQCSRRACTHPWGDCCWVLPGKVPAWPSPDADRDENFGRRELWFGAVAERLGEEDARAHTALPTDPSPGPLLIVRHNRPLWFEGYPDPAPDGERWAMTVGTVDARGGVVVTHARELWHTLLPARVRLVPMGHNLAAYASSLDSAGLLTARVVEVLCGYYRLGVACAMARQATSRCRCGLIEEAHWPEPERLRAFAAAVARDHT